MNTDSIIADVSLDGVILISNKNELGKFKLQYSGEGEILGNGSYYIIDPKKGTELVLSGIARSDRTGVWVSRFLSGEDVEYYLNRSYKEMSDVERTNIARFRYNSSKDRTLNFVAYERGYFGLPLDSNQVDRIRPIDNKAYKATKRKLVESSDLHDMNFPLNMNKLI